MSGYPELMQTAAAVHARGEQPNTQVAVTDLPYYSLVNNANVTA